MRMDTQYRNALAAVLAAAAIYAIVVLVWGRLQFVDEVAFKSAGREWAASGRFASPELRGFGDFHPPVEEKWFAQLPVYTFLFGVFVKLFGFGPTTTILFDVLIHAALALLTYAAARALAPELSPWRAAIAGIAVVPVVTFGRADELAVCFALASTIALLRRRLFTSAILLGFCGATSAVCAFLYVIIASYRIVTTEGVRRAILWGAVAVAATIATLLPFAVSPPGVYRQFFGHVKRQFGGSWLDAMTASMRYGGHYAAMVLVAAIVALADLRSGGREWVRAWFGCAAATAVIVVFLPSKYLYFWFVAPIAMAIAATRPLRRPAIPLALAALVWCAAAVPLARDTLVMMHLPAAQQLEPNVAAIRRVIPRGSTVLAAEYWSSIGNDYHYLYRYAVPGNPPLPDDVNYIVLTANGSGRAGVPQPLGPTEAAYVRDHFTVVYDNLNRAPSTLIGPLKTHSGWGFGALVLARRGIAAPSAAHVVEQ